MANRSADSPGDQILRPRPQHENARLVERHHGVESNLEELLDVPKVADDFLGRPVVSVGPPGQLGVRLPGDCVPQFFGSLPELLKKRFGREPAALFSGWHGVNLRGASA